MGTYEVRSHKISKEAPARGARYEQRRMSVLDWTSMNLFLLQRSILSDRVPQTSCIHGLLFIADVVGAWSDPMVTNLRIEEWHSLHQRLRSIAQRRAALDAEEARCLRDAERIELWRRLGRSEE